MSRESVVKHAEEKKDADVRPLRSVCTPKM